MPAVIEKLGQIPSLASGGYIKSGGLAYLHSGEHVTSGSPITINIPIYGGRDSADEIANKVIQKLDRIIDVNTRRGYVPNQYARN